MLRFALDLKAKARGPEVSQKHKNEVLEVNDPLCEKFRNSVPKEFMIKPIYVL